MQKILKQSIALASIMIMMTSMLTLIASPVHADAGGLNLYGSGTGDAITNTGLGAKDPVSIASSILNVLHHLL